MHRNQVLNQGLAPALVAPRPPPWLTALAFLATATCGSTAKPSGNGAVHPTGEGADSSVAAGGACPEANSAVDPADGKCKPNGKTSNVGATCSTSGKDPACGAHPAAACYDETNDNFPGGYCTVESCDTNVLCPVGAACANVSGEKPACLKICKTDADCRAPDYRCWNVAGFYLSGASHSVCYLAVWPCTMDSECPPAAPRCQLSLPPSVPEDGGVPPDNEGTCRVPGIPTGGTGGGGGAGGSGGGGGPADASASAADGGGTDVCAGYRSNGMLPGVSAVAFCAEWGAVCGFGAGPGKYAGPAACQTSYNAAGAANQSCRAARLCNARDTSSAGLRAEHCGYASGTGQCS